VIEHCPVSSKPRQIEFARLNLTYTVMSKRKLLQLVRDRHVNGWDDPRLPTISGIRRRGYPAEAIRNFCARIGITKFNGMTRVELLEHEVRDVLNREAPRRMAVLEPLRVVLTNVAETEVFSCEVQEHPEFPERGVRHVEHGKELWIERDDFMIDPPKKFFRLGPERYVRLRGGNIMKYVAHEVDAASGEVTLVRCELLKGTAGASSPEGVVCKAAIHWVDGDRALDAEFRLYDRLFTVEEPDAVEEGFVHVLNPASLKIVRGKIEPSLAQAEVEKAFQFERVGYFVADRKDHAETSPVFNRAVGLKDSWSKIAPH
jgi:glutaminyl-tRNA synthetase